MNPIEIKNLNFSYDQTQDVVKDVSFVVKKGSYTTLIGHNGSGKSTIAKLIIGLLEKEKGSILIDGEELSLETIEGIRRKIGIVFQNPDNQFIGATVRDDIAFGLENHQVAPSEMDEIIENYAKEVGMSEYLDHEPTRLSGGQKQRVAIAGILSMKPEILILDEATSMLDPEGKEDINNLVKQLHKENNMTILSITHDVEEVLKSDHVIVMYEGRIVKDGPPSEVMKNEDELVRLKLAAPYSVRLANELKKLGIPVKQAWDMEGMVDELCQLLLNK
jgi:energy-coupling factor transport system ATP-binding protein